MKKILLIILILSVGFSQQNWNMKYMEEYGGVTYAPNSDKPYTGKVYSFYESGETKEEGKYRNGLKDGKWTSWFENGQKSYEGTLKDEKIDGLYTEWYENGQKKFEGTLKDGKKDGLLTWWYENGHKKSEGSYNDDEKDGLSTGWNYIGQKTIEETYKYGEEIEETRWTYYVNGQKEFEETYKDGERGVFTSWFENGQKSYEGTFKDGRYDGLRTEWYENGQKKSEQTYKGGKLDGLWTYWHKNGQKKMERTWKNGKEDGLWTEWYENGQKSSERTYRDGELDGLYTDWYENGQKSSERTYRDGERDGLWTDWYELGQKKREVQISSTITGWITEITVLKGDTVQQGQHLISIDDKQYRKHYNQVLSQVKSSEANLRKVKSQMDRTKSLFSQKLISEQELDQIEASYQIAVSQSEQANNNLLSSEDELSKTQIMAPVYGIVTSLSKEVGDMAVGGMFNPGVLMTVTDLSRMEVEVDVNANDNGQKKREVTFKDGELISSKCLDKDGNEYECADDDW